MSICRACGGVLGRDCFNETECMNISNNNQNYAEYEIKQLRHELLILRKAIVDFGIPIPEIENENSTSSYPDDLPF